MSHYDKEMMTVYVRLLATYRRYLPPGTPESTYEMEVAAGTRVDELVARLPVPADEPKVVLVNGRSPQEGQVLEPGDVVCLFPAIAGG